MNIYMFGQINTQDPSGKLIITVKILYTIGKSQSDSDDGIDMILFSMKEKNKIVSYLDTFILKDYIK